MNPFDVYDYMALLWFICSWLLFIWLVEHSPWASRSLSANMGQQRREWMRQLNCRELRIVDTSINAGLQQGTAFFASSCLLGIGGCFALLGATDEVLAVFRDLPFQLEQNRGVWESKVVGLLAIYAYAFFKFGWAYRLFNYCSILIGAVPVVEAGVAEGEVAAMKAAEMNILAGKHFNAGLRAVFFSLGYIGWFLGALPFALSTLLITMVVTRRQFFSKARLVAS